MNNIKSSKQPLSVVGARLPIGLRDATGAYVKDIATRPWRMKEERELGELRDQNRGAHVAQFVSLVLSTMCTRIGNYDFTTIGMAERRVVISQMFMCDVFYAYIWLRIQSLGTQMATEIVCPNCNKKFEMAADLETIEVTTAENLEDTLWMYELKNPFTIRQDNVTSIQFGPARWNALEMMGAIGSINTGAAKAAVIKASIHNIVNPSGALVPVALADHELDDMSKMDIENISAQIDNRAMGPNMGIDYACPNCRRSGKVTLDWGYDGFFGASGR